MFLQKGLDRFLAQQPVGQITPSPAQLFRPAAANDTLCLQAMRSEMRDA